MEYCIELGYRDLGICLYISYTVIHSTVIWLFASLHSRIDGRVSFCYTDKNDFNEVWDGASMNCAIYFLESHAWILLSILWESKKSI